MKRVLVWSGILAILVSLLVIEFSTLPGPVTAQQIEDGRSTLVVPVVFSDFAGISKRDWTILLKSRSFEPEPGLEASLATRLRLDHPGRTHVLIQFNRVPTAAERKALADRGATLLGYIPNLTWLASIPSDEAMALRILELSPTRWLGSLLPATQSLAGAKDDRKPKGSTSTG